MSFFMFGKVSMWKQTWEELYKIPVGIIRKLISMRGFNPFSSTFSISKTSQK